MRYLVLQPLRLLWALFFSVVAIIIGILALVISFLWYFSLKHYRHGAVDIFSKQTWEYEVCEDWENSYGNRCVYKSVWHWAVKAKPIKTYKKPSSDI
jgi:hypothetical protein